MECEYCNKLLKSQAVLKKHQTTAKYCLLKQNKVPSKEYMCEFCGTCFTVKISMQTHLKICKANTPCLQTQLYLFEQTKKDLEASLNREKKLVETIQELRKEITEYKEKMFFLASKPTHHINNIGNTKLINKTQNLIISDWRKETIEEKVEENFSLEHVEDGIKGVARFAFKYITPVENGIMRYQCTDSNREIFMYKDSDGVVQKDIRASKLKQAIKDPIIKKSEKLVIEERSRLTELITNEKDDSLYISNYKIENLTDKFLEIKHIHESNSFSKEMALLSI